MNDEEFMERIRSGAAELRYEPEDPFVWTRLQSRVRDRISQPAGVFDLLFAWRRRVLMMLVALALASGLSLFSYWNLGGDSLDSVAETAIVTEDYYRVAQ